MRKEEMQAILNRFEINRGVTSFPDCSFDLLLSITILMLQNLEAALETRGAVPSVVDYCLEL